ncbi:hypothetical protein [Amycolatopsis sp. cmx-4-83]|uniref:hypothetical protein n=1 Tax=Amycolatopsis sp. cmx-4-83 TaxID=2790940 RepID=UPI00397D75F6
MPDTPPEPTGAASAKRLSAATPPEPAAPPRQLAAEPTSATPPRQPGGAAPPEPAVAPTSLGQLPAEPASATRPRPSTPPGRPAEPAVRLAAAIRIVLLGVTAVIQPGLGLAPLLRHQSAYRPPLAADLAFLVLAGVTVTCAWWVLRRKPLPLAVSVVGTLVVLAASSVATAALPPDSFFREPHWSFGLVGWHLLVLLADRLPALLTALALHVGASVAQFLVAGPVARTEFGDAAIVLFGVTVFQVAVAGLFGLLDRRSNEAAAAAAERDRLATRAAVAAQAGEALRTGFAEQLGATLPLLAGLADGTVDPRTAEARARCGLAAAQLRRLFAENDDVPDPLVHEVTACLDVAERRGVAVALAVSGDPVDVPAPARRELTGPVLTALAAARTRARVSVLRTPELVRVAVVADGTSEFSGSAAVPVASHSRDGQTWMEARWRPE